MITKLPIFVIILIRIQISADLDFVEKNLQDPKLQVRITSGLIQGSNDVTVDRNVTYYKFLGVPFAAPPVGPLRWMPPVAHDEWAGVLNATYEGPPCVQMSAVEGVEDCLFINVYTPQNISVLNQTEPMAVMVWIYGGRFANGYSNYSVYGPDYLLEKGVVFVSFNYRMGIFGFLSTDDLSLPGNYGLKDQVFALKWVKQNIKNFGGDPNRVTIFGDSSGAACVSYLLLIPQANGLFHRAISESGSVLCPWAFQRDPRKIAIMLAVATGIFEADLQAMVEQLRLEDTWKLRTRMLAINLGSVLEPLNGLPFAPCLEPFHEGAVLTNHSNDMFLAGQFNRVPYMIGFTSQEASIVQDVIEKTRPYIVHWDIMPQLILPSNLNITSKEDRRAVALMIKNFYFGKKIIAMSSKLDMMNFIGDTQFVRAIRHNVQVCALYTDIYLYVFSYEGWLGRYGTTKEVSRKVKGPGHVEDLFYLFRQGNLKTQNATDLQVLSIMTQMWTNFAKIGKPYPDNDTIYWPPNNEKDTTLTYLNIDSSLSIKHNPRAESMDFWDDLYKQYGSSYYDTY